MNTKTSIWIIGVCFIALATALILYSRSKPPSVVSMITNGCHATQVNPSDSQSFLPDTVCTPGVTDSTVIQTTIIQTICKKGYTATVRPPVSYTEKLKREQIIQYGYHDTNLADYEEDHFIPLELGGSPRDPKNLWPEPHPSLNEKDKVEDYLHTEVCAGKITLMEAQREITKNWYEVYNSIKI